MSPNTLDYLLARYLQAPLSSELDSLIALAPSLDTTTRFELLRSLRTESLTDSQHLALARLTLTFEETWVFTEHLTFPAFPLPLAAQLLTENPDRLHVFAPFPPERAIATFRALSGDNLATLSALRVSSSLPDAAFEVFLRLLADQAAPQTDFPRYARRLVELALLAAS